MPHLFEHGYALVSRTLDRKGHETTIMKKCCKIVFLVTESWYFLSHRLDLARACRDRGWDVVVVTREAPDALIDEPGIRVVPLLMQRAGRHPARELATLFHVYKILRDERPDILHAVGLKPVLYGATVARLAGVRTVIAVLSGMGYIFMSASLRIALIRAGLVRWLRLALRQRNAWLIVQNNDDADMLISGRVVTNKQVRVIRGSGVDLEHFRPKPEPEGIPIFAVVCRMLTDKGIREVVWAARELARQRIPVRVWLLGAPDPENPTSLSRAQLAAWHAEGCVEWLGHQRDIHTVLHQAHVCMLPSYREGLPKALLEGAACGRPIITTDVPGCREVVRAGQDGLLVPVGDWCALAEAMATLATDPELRQRLGAEARKYAEQEFGTPAIVGQVMDLYADALASTP